MPKEVKKGVIPKGRPKSGRVWKSQKQRYSAMKADKPLKSSWSVKMKQRLEMKAMKARDKEMKDEKIRLIEEKKHRREENLKRREENAKKAEVVQVIKNSAKIKRMSKKQLRSIQKR